MLSEDSCQMMWNIPLFFTVVFYCNFEGSVSFMMSIHRGLEFSLVVFCLILF